MILCPICREAVPASFAYRTLVPHINREGKRSSQWGMLFECCSTLATISPAYRPAQATKSQINSSPWKPVDLEIKEVKTPRARRAGAREQAARKRRPGAVAKE
jgi:hypothetical protein